MSLKPYKRSTLADKIEAQAKAEKERKNDEANSKNGSKGLKKK